jgi:very-short-patch-repair endonuclease
MEARLRKLLVMARLPRPAPRSHQTINRVASLAAPICTIRSTKLALEYDRGTRRDGLVEDNRRQNRLLNAGIRMLRFTAADILQAPESVIGQVRLAISKRGP